MVMSIVIDILHVATTAKRDQSFNANLQKMLFCLNLKLLILQNIA